MNVQQIIAALGIITIGLASCSTLQPAVRKGINAVQNDITNLSPQFLQVENTSPKTTSNKLTSVAKLTTPNTIQATYTVTYPNNITSKVVAEAFIMPQLKYAIALDIAAEQATSLQLYNFLEDWLHTRYRFGGQGRGGIDCSALMQKIYTTIYYKELPRTAILQYQATQRILREELQEGDLIFFHTTRSGISHVGMYIANNRFVHASSSQGVTISNLNEKYYVNAYRGCGRLVNTVALK